MAIGMEEIQKVVLELKQDIVKKAKLEAIEEVKAKICPCERCDFCETEEKKKAECSRCINDDFIPLSDLYAILDRIIKNLDADEDDLK